MESLQEKIESVFPLTAEQWGMISSCVKIMSLPKDGFFIEQNKVCRNSGFILEGVMRYFSYDKDGNDPTCYFSYENQYIIDPFTFRKQISSDMNLQAVTNCKLAVISLAKDNELRSIFPPWNDISNQLLLEVSMDFANQKELLAMNASMRYDYFMKKYPSVAKRTPLQYVASYLGIAQPSLSRVRKNIL